MFKYLIEEIKKMEGNVIALGIDDKLINSLKKNKKINAFEISKSDRISFFNSETQLMPNFA